MAMAILLPLSGTGLGGTFGPTWPISHKGSLLGVSGEIFFPNRRQRDAVRTIPSSPGRRSSCLKRYDDKVMHAAKTRASQGC